MMLCVGLGRVEMGAWMEKLQEGRQGLNALARQLEATITLNVAGILEV